MQTQSTIDSPSCISLVIPVRNDQALLRELLEKVFSQTLRPSEIVIIDSSDQPWEIDASADACFSKAGIALRYFHEKQPLNPGAARNLGIHQAACEFIAFLDVQTLPSPNWLEDAFRVLKQEGSCGIFGQTVYLANSPLEKRIRAATYGLRPVTTIPGSLLRRQAFAIVGSFLSSVVAGEDTDWMIRARLHGLALSLPKSASLAYTGLIGMSFSRLIRKWLRNYKACRDIPYLSDHKAIYLFLFNVLAIFVALHWNSVIANWNESSSVYISHVTKLTVGILSVLYAGYRGFYLPMRRGASLRFLLPLEWLLVCCVGLTIDIVKIFAFIPSMRVIAGRMRFALLRE